MVNTVHPLHSEHFFLFQLNAHSMLHTCLYHQLPPTSFGVCYTIFRETIILLAPKLYAFCNTAVKGTIHPFLLIYSAVTMFKTICIPSFCILKILKMLVYDTEGRNTYCFKQCNSTVN